MRFYPLLGNGVAFRYSAHAIACFSSHGLGVCRSFVVCHKAYSPARRDMRFQWKHVMKIVVLDGFTLNPGDLSWSSLESLGELDVFDRTKPSQVVIRAKDADVLVVNKVRISKEHLQRLPTVGLIAVTATGFDCVDIDAARKKNVSVCNVPEYGTSSVAQFVFAQLLDLCHRVDLHDQAIRAGEWSERGDFSFCLTPQVELTGRTMGIVGLGRIGSRVAQLAQAFGMQVIAHTRSPDTAKSVAGVEVVTLEQLAQRADVISLHCPLTPSTQGMIDAKFLTKCKPNAILINASRGALVKENDLAEALSGGQLAGVALDVMSSEPIGMDNPLLEAPRCRITPHMAWASKQARQRLLDTTVANITNFQNGDLTNVVNS